MFTSFDTENTPAIKVWDFSKTFASSTASRSISLSDDCAPIQVIKTGSTTTAIKLYLPSSPVEGKTIKIINTPIGSSNQSISIFSSDLYFYGASVSILGIGSSQCIELCYLKDCYTSTTGTGSGWIALNQGSSSSRAIDAISFGSGNHASSTGTAAIGGSSNSITGAYSASLGGSSNTVGGSYASVISGSVNNASGQYSTVIGGSGSTANSTSSIVHGGDYGTTRSIYGNNVSSSSVSPIATSIGVNQTGRLIIATQTTDATTTILRSNTTVASTINQIILPNNSAYYFSGTVIANVTGGGNTKAWTFDGAIKRGANAASVVLVGTPTVTSNYADAGASAWTIALSTDTTNGGLKVEVTGAAATTIRWVCKIDTTEVTF